MQGVEGFPEASVPVIVTVRVVWQPAVTSSLLQPGVAPGQLSITVTSASTLAQSGIEAGLQPRAPPVGQPAMVGGSLSVTVTVKLHESEPQPFLAVQETEVVPTGKP